MLNSINVVSVGGFILLLLGLLSPLGVIVYDRTNHAALVSGGLQSFFTSIERCNFARQLYFVSFILSFLAVCVVTVVLLYTGHPVEATAVIFVSFVVVVVKQYIRQLRDVEAWFKQRYPDNSETQFVVGLD